MLELTIKSAVPADLDDILVLARSCIEEMRGRGIEQWDEVYPARDTFESDVAAGTLYAAWCGPGCLAGVFTLDEYQTPDWAAVPWTILGLRTAVVHRLMVAPHYQGQGMARQLMRYAESEASTAGYEVMRLDAFSLNPQALRLYQTLGYREVGSGNFRKGVFRCFEKRLGAEAAAQ
jgi:GNAT superfamily N-acetyltransferase